MKDEETINNVLKESINNFNSKMYYEDKMNFILIKDVYDVFKECIEDINKEYEGNINLIMDYELYLDYDEDRKYWQHYVFFEISHYIEENVDKPYNQYIEENDKPYNYSSNCSDDDYYDEKNNIIYRKVIDFRKSIYEMKDERRNYNINKLLEK